jgi:hypothetical protein
LTQAADRLHNRDTMFRPFTGLAVESMHQHAIYGALVMEVVV